MSGLKAVQGFALVDKDGKILITSLDYTEYGVWSHFHHMTMDQAKEQGYSCQQVTVTISASGEYERGLEDAALACQEYADKRDIEAQDMHQRGFYNEEVNVRNHAATARLLSTVVRALAGKREQEGRG